MLSLLGSLLEDESLKEQGFWDASTNNPTLTNGIGVQGYFYVVSVGGTVNFGAGNITFTVGDWVYYNTANEWVKFETGVGYVPEDVANKSTDGTMSANSSTLYPSQSAVVTYASAKVADSITDGVTTIAPSQNAVFDALALKQNSSATLAGLAATTIVANDLLYGSGPGVFSTTTLTSAARTVLDDASVAAMVNTLGGATSTGSGGLVRATSPTLVTPALGTPASGVLTNCTGYPRTALPVGTCVQVVSTVKTDTASTTSSTYAAITGISATITPGATTNNIRVTIVLQIGATALARGNFQVFRGATKVNSATGGLNRTQDSAVYYSPSADSMGTVAIDFVDSPATTAATTYTVQWSSPDNTSTILLNRTLADTNLATFPRTASNITLMEIKG